VLHNRRGKPQATSRTSKSTILWQKSARLRESSSR
jgi:hypothetical protein